MTIGIYDDPTAGPTVIHFPVPLDAPGVTVLDTWRVLGMRGTGSHDIELKDVFVPDAATQGVRRPGGQVAPVDARRLLDRAADRLFARTWASPRRRASWRWRAAKKRKEDPSTRVPRRRHGGAARHRAGRCTRDMVELARTAKPGPETTVAHAHPRGIVANAIIRTVEKALEVAGGGSFYRIGDARAPVPRRAGGPLSPAARPPARAPRRARPPRPRHRRLDRMRPGAQREYRCA